MVPVAETILAVPGATQGSHGVWIPVVPTIDTGMEAWVLFTTLATLTYILSLCFIRWQFQKLETSPTPHKHPWSPFQFHYCFQVS